MNVLLLLAGLVCLSPVGSQSQVQSPNSGVIYGTVLAPDGTPAKGLTLNAMPLGAALGMILPWTKTNEFGVYRFQQLPWGRYTVFAEDKEAGYSSFSTGMQYTDPPAAVEISAANPEAQFDLHLPPPAGFLLLHLTNRSTGAPISGIQVTVTSQEIPAKTIFSGGFSSSGPILVPSDKDLLLHVTSRGFLEWNESVGVGKHIRLAPGNRLTLDVQLQPSNALTQRIPGADPKKYQGIHDAKQWQNPYLMVRADGIELAGATDGRTPLTIDALAAALERLPDSAWPYGRVVAVQESCVLATASEHKQIAATRDQLVQRLADLGIIVYFLPSA